MQPPAVHKLDEVWVGLLVNDNEAGAHRLGGSSVADINGVGEGALDRPVASRWLTHSEPFSKTSNSPCNNTRPRLNGIPRQNRNPFK